MYILHYSLVVPKNPEEDGESEKRVGALRITFSNAHIPSLICKSILFESLKTLLEIWIDDDRF